MKQVAALEISNRCYKLVIGYVLDNKINIIYKTKKPLSVPFKDGDIFDIGSLSDDLSKINAFEIDGDSHKLKVKINEVALILPSYGLEVYKCQKTTNTVSNVSKIDKIDISNALALVKKEKLPNPNNVLVDIVPNKFIIDGNREYIIPPLNEISQTITIDTNVYTLPSKMISDMKHACEKSGIRIKREVIAPIGVAQLLAGLKFKYQTYVLVDISSKTTTLSFVGKNTVYSSNFFSLGIADLTDKYITDFSITREKADELRNLYGFDQRKLDYNPPIIESMNSNGQIKKYTKEDLNNSTSAFLKTWISWFSGSFKSLLEQYPTLMTNIPLVLLGEGTKLNGLKEYMLKTFNSNPLEIISLPIVGCRDNEYANCLSAIYVSYSYRGALEDDNKLHVSELNRITDSNNTKEKVKESDKYSELHDEL
jgi:cell division ATPase FtsA